MLFWSVESRVELQVEPLFEPLSNQRNYLKALVYLSSKDNLIMHPPTWRDRFLRRLIREARPRESQMRISQHPSAKRHL